MVYTYTVIYWLTAMATSLIVHLHTQFSKLMIAVDICSCVAICYGKGYVDQWLVKCSIVWVTYKNKK